MNVWFEVDQQIKQNYFELMESHRKIQSLAPKQEPNNIFTEKGKFRISPTKNRQSFMNKDIKPFSSYVMPQKKAETAKEDFFKRNSKLQLIKSKCMKGAKSVTRSDSKHNLQSQWLLNEALNESVDLESQSDKKEKVNKVSLVRSRFPDRPPTIFFYYPKCCKAQQNTENVFSIDKGHVYYKIQGSAYRCIINSLEQNGFKQSQGNDWNIFFDITGIHHQKALETMNKYQKINHFPGCWQLGRKDYMWKNLTKQRRAHPEDYNFVPTTYIFPIDFDRFQIARDNAPKDQLWILKPTNSACGRGIKMVNKETKIKSKKDILVSEYIANPHLINNFKYDLRVYVLVTSYDPLKIYMFNDGLARFATYEYNTNAKDIKKRFIHLTNFAINKHSKKFVKNSKAEKDGQGSKWSLAALRAHYESVGINSEKLFQGIKDIIIKTCISAEPVMLDIFSKTQQKRSCGFELYGFDILIDSHLKPWLMEVNVCPSLSSSSPMDRKIKHTLLTDTLNMIGIQYYSRKGLEKEKKKEKQKFLQRQDKKYYSKHINNIQSLTYKNCVQMLAPEDWLMLFEACEELDRMGNFERIFPLKSNINYYKQFFQFNRYNNHVLWKYLKSDNDFIHKLYP